MTPVPPSAPQPRAATTAQPPSADARRNQIIVFAVIIIALVVLARACVPTPNKYERIARGMTEAIVRNDVAAVKSYQNAETATDVNRARVGHAADVLTPLGKLERVHETTPKDDPPRVHEFDLTFQHGKVHEKMKFDPDDKIVRFQYDVTSGAAAQ